MKVKIIKCSVPGSWYEHRIGDEIEVAHQHVIVNNQFFLNAKTHHYYHGQTGEQDLISMGDVMIVDASGSSFEDGYDLGLVHGRFQYHRELVDEGILLSEDEMVEMGLIPKDYV